MIINDNKKMTTYSYISVTVDSFLKPSWTTTYVESHIALFANISKSIHIFNDQWDKIMELGVIKKLIFDSFFNLISISSYIRIPIKAKSNVK